MNELVTHPQGDEKNQALALISGPVAVDTFGGRVPVEWNPQAAVTPLGQLPFFIEFFKVSGLFDPWVEQCPLGWDSPNAPRKRDVLGTALLSILSGHQRSAHINGLRGEGVNPALLGMRKVESRGFGPSGILEDGRKRLSLALVKYLHGRQLQPPALAASPRLSVRAG
jgi:hypothetical protein